MRALIVDDSSFMREYLRLHFTRLGIACSQAEDGREALEVLRADRAFDLMLLDVNMPVMDGMECVRMLRAERLGGDMKVMMVTTEADHSYVSRALENGADEFLMKPFTPQSLQEKLLLLGVDVSALQAAAGGKR